MSQLDSTQPAGTAPDANPPVSAAGVQPNSFDPDRFVATVEAKLIERLAGNPRLLQSLTDKTISRVENNKGFKEWRDQYRAMKQRGMTDDQIDNEIRLAELEARVDQPAPVAPGSPTSDSGANDLEDLLPDLGLAPDDGDVLRIMAQPTTSLAKAKELARLSQRRKNPINPAAVGQGADTPAPKADYGQMAREYKQKALAAKGNRALIRQIQSEYQAKGLVVEGIDLTAP